MGNIPDWETVKSELIKKWWIVLLCIMSGLWQAINILFPGMSSPFK